MTAIKEEQALSVTEVGERLGLSEHTVRYYDRAGLLGPVPRGVAGQRVFGEAELARVRFVATMRRTGMPIRVLRRYLELDPGDRASVPDRRAILAAHREAVRAQLAECEQALRMIDRKIAMYDAGTLYEPQEDDE